MGRSVMRFKVLILFLITASCGFCLMRPAPAEVVNIPDPNLQAAINKGLNKPSDAPFTASEMLSLTTLTVEDIGISDLTGLEYASNLVELSLIGRTLTREEQTRFRGRKYDGRLYHLHNSSTPLVDVAPLASQLKKLTKLRIQDLHLVEVAPLSKLKNLTELKLSNSWLRDISPLSALTHLSKLDLSRNGISDVTPLIGLTHLTDVTLASNAISDISPLSGLTQLTTLNLNDNIISHLSPLSGLTHLQTLSLRNNEISDVSPLTDLTRLIRLEVGNESFLFANYNRIVDLSSLATLTELEWLSLGNNKLTDVSALADLPNLVYLDLAIHVKLDLYGDTRLDISPLADLPNLETLDLRHIPLTADALKHISTLEANGTDVRFTPPAPVAPPHRDNPEK